MNTKSVSRVAIVCFAYNRPRHLQITLRALAKNAEAASLPLFVYVDGAKNDFDNFAISEAVDVAQSFSSFFQRFTLKVREANFGLFRSLTLGITEVLEQFDQVIVLEDDIVVSKVFLSYVLQALDFYEYEKDVASIHGYTPAFATNLPQSFFLKGADCWGWATWKDRWSLFRDDAALMLRELQQQNSVHEFDLLGAYPYSGLLKARAARQSSSWAICWHASCFLAGKYTLYPGTSLVKNIGLDNSGEHCGDLRFMDVNTFSSFPISQYPERVQQDSDIFAMYSDYFFSQLQSDRQPLLQRFKKILVRARTKLASFRSKPVVHCLELTGPFSTYELAQNSSTGYCSSVILNKVRHAVVDVLDGKAIYERDGSTFDQRPQGLKIRELLQRCLLSGSSVLDVGGGLGSTYINNPELFQESNQYLVLEQSSFVEVGNQIANTYQLPIQFFDSISCVHDKIDWVILSSVLPYLPDSVTMIQDVLTLEPKQIVIDRQPVSKSSQIQVEPWWIQNESTYYSEPVSYPIELLSEDYLISLFPGYSCIDKWTNDFDAVVPPHYGYLLVRE